MRRIYHALVACLVAVSLTFASLSPAQAGLIRSLAWRAGVVLLAREAVVICARTATCRGATIAAAERAAFAVFRRMGGEQAVACLESRACRGAALGVIQAVLNGERGAEDWNQAEARPHSSGASKGGGTVPQSTPSDPNDDQKRRLAAERKDSRQDTDGNPLGTKGTAADSKTIDKRGVPGERGYWRIDVENPSPGERPGNLHAQFGEKGSEHIYYNHWTNTWENISPAQAKILDNPAAMDAIKKGLRYLKP